MRKHHVLGLLGLSLLLAAPVSAQDPVPKPGKDERPGARRERPADQDGPRTDADRPGQRRGGAERDGVALRRMILARYDANQNGTLEPPELQRLAREVNAGGGKGRQGDRPGPGPRGGDVGDKPPGPGPRGQRGDRGGPPVTGELLKRYDANQNGKLDPEEREKMRADQARQRGDATPPERRGRRGGGEENPPVRRGGRGGGAGQNG